MKKNKELEQFEDYLQQRFDVVGTLSLIEIRTILSQYIDIDELHDNEFEMVSQVYGEYWDSIDNGAKVN